MALPRSFQIDRSSNTPLTQQIFDHYQNAIRSGGILFGTRLPSIRDLATHLHVNKISVISAYERLVDAGLAVSRPGSGFYVSHRASASHHRTLALHARSSAAHHASNGAQNGVHRSVPNSTQNQAASRRGPGTDTTLERLPQVLKATWHPPSHVVALGSNHVPLERALLDELRSVARHVLLDSEKINLAYEHPQGNPELRERLSAELELRGIPVPDANQVIITSGAVQALNLALDVLAQPGDAVAIEMPAFTLMFPMLAQKRLRLMEMPRSFEGFSISPEMEKAIGREKPKVIVVSPNFHNPLGGTLSPHQRHEVVRLAMETGATIIELDVFSGLHFGELMLPPVSSLDALQRTLYVSSFSKTLSPGLRLGYACGSPALIARMMHRKALYDISTSSLDQALLCEFMVRGHLRKHLHRVKELYRSRRDTLTAMLRKLAPQGSKWTTPEGGLFLWFEFPPGPSPLEMESVCLERGVAIAPGSLFLPAGRESQGMRLNFASLEAVHTYKALETVFALWRAAQSRRWAGATP